MRSDVGGFTQTQETDSIGHATRISATGIVTTKEKQRLQSFSQPWDTNNNYGRGKPSKPDKK